MKILLFSSANDILDEWHQMCKEHECRNVYDLEMFKKALLEVPESISIVDYDSVSSDLNRLIAGNKLPRKTVILESIPVVLVGKMLIANGVVAYGNSRMLYIHYKKMLQTVESGDVWTYPELTATLVKREGDLSQKAQEFLEHRLTEQEKKVVKEILHGLTNEAIAHNLGVTIRTVKAHIGSLFSKLHVNDRVGLILLLK